MKKRYKLSNKELEVMQVLWCTNESLAATDIPKHNPDLNINTVQSVLRSLSNKSFIKIADIVYHNTVLTRTYEPILSQEDYMVDQFESTSLTMDTFISTLVKKETDSKNLETLEALIQEQKSKIARERE